MRLRQVFFKVLRRTIWHPASACVSDRSAMFRLKHKRRHYAPERLNYRWYQAGWHWHGDVSSLSSFKRCVGFGARPQPWKSLKNQWEPSSSYLWIGWNLLQRDAPQGKNTGILLHVANWELTNIINYQETCCYFSFMCDMQKLSIINLIDNQNRPDPV